MDSEARLTASHLSPRSHRHLPRISPTARSGSPASIPRSLRGCPVIGIVGGVGSGKSSIVAGLSGFHLQIIDADQIGHRQLLLPHVRSALVDHFGPQILAESGEIHRPALAKLVFGDTAAQQASRETLNQIVRPGIRNEILQQLQNVPPQIDAVVLDAALLLESGLDQLCESPDLHRHPRSTPSSANSRHSRVVLRRTPPPRTFTMASGT
ncbi:MAG UNVERIFIED_CONTAM: dephospho-CoA kinase [Planctomycetaceae bacterium]